MLGAATKESFVNRSRGLSDKMKKVLATVEKGLKRRRMEEARRGRVAKVFKLIFVARASQAAAKRRRIEKFEETMQQLGDDAKAVRFIYLHKKFALQEGDFSMYLPDGCRRVANILNAQVVVTNDLSEHSNVQSLVHAC